MAFRSLEFIPGLNAQFTATLNHAGWVGELLEGVPTTNLIRYSKDAKGLPEVIGGWSLFLQPAAVLLGICRGLHSWATLEGVSTLAAGTTSHLYIIQNYIPYDITPIAFTSALTNPFTTIISTPTVTVHDTSVTPFPSPGDYIEMGGSYSVGGLALSGEYVIITANAGANTYTITASGNATSSATGGGSVTINYLIPTGPVDESQLAGWGIGPWGIGPWGTPRSASGGTGFPSIWQIDNWGEDLVAVRGPSNVYVWDIGTTPTYDPISPPDVTHRAIRMPGDARATNTAIAGAGMLANGVLVADPQQQLIVWGISIPNPVAGTWGAQDPMLMGWSDFSNYQVMFASATNAAGSFRLNDGSMIMQVLKSQGQMLCWTDTALFSMQFINVPLVYGFQKLGAGCGLVSPKAAVVVGSQAFWWSRKGFMQYGGTVTPLPCPVADLCIGNLNAGQKFKICASSNTEFSEVQWEFPSAGGNGENDSYVSYNWVNGTWSFGATANGVPVGRTARIDNGVIPNPIGADAAGNLWAHESGYTAGGQAMPWSAQSGFADTAEGEEFSFVDQIIPDAIWEEEGSITGNIGITVLAQDYPTDAPQMFGPFNAGPDTRYLSLRARSRQIAINFANTNSVVGIFWRLGRVRVRVAADGRR